MMDIQSVIPNAVSEIVKENDWRSRKYTPEEIEEARRKVARQNALCDPDCEICGGVGYISAGAGKVNPCPKLFQKSIRAGAARYGLTSGEVDTLNWDKLLPLNAGPEVAEVVQDHLKRGYGWLFLWGDHGQAKTLLLKIAVAAALKSGIEAAYANMVDILDNLKKAFDNKEGDADAETKLEWWQRLPLLCVDEFNRLKETEWVKERRFVLIDHRYTQAIREETLTIIVSNDGPDKQEPYLRDRINDGRFQIIHLEGKSARPSIKPGFRY